MSVPERRSTLPLRLMLVALVCVLPVAALTAYLSQARRADDVKQAHHEARLVVRFVADQLADTMAATKRLLAALATERGERDSRRSDCSRALDRTLRLFPLYHQIVLTDSEGNVRCSAKPLRGPLHIGDREYFQQAVATRSFVVSDVIRGRDSGRWTVTAARPYDDGHSRGFVVAAFDLDKLNEQLAAAPLPRGAVLSVVDVAGRIALRVPGAAQYSGRIVQEPAVFSASIRRSAHGVSHVTTLDDVNRIIAYQRLPSTPLYVRLGLPKKDLDVAASRVLYGGLAALAAVLALALASAWGVSHCLVARPLRQIVRSAQRFTGGDASARTGIEHHHPVIGSLARALDALAASRQRVSRALRTLSMGNRTLLQAQTETELLAQMCRVAVEAGGYPLAFVAYRQDDAARSVTVMAQHGRSDGFVEGLRLSWGEDAWGRGSVGTAIRTGEHCVLHSVSDDPRYAPWREAALKRGFRSVISLPLRVDGAATGTFTLHAPEEDAFDEAEVELLDEMAADLSFGIAAIRARAKQLEAEAAAERARTRDRLTGLANHTVFAAEVAKALEAGHGAGAAIVVLHLSRLQDVFDGFGYGPGDALVREIARRVGEVADPAHRVARVSFSDFGVYLPYAESGAVARMAHAMRSVIHRPIAVGTVEIAVHGSVGASFFPDHGDDAELLVRRASIAAREGTRQHAAYFKYRGGIERENPARLALAADLTTAMERGHLTLHYQPKLDLRTAQLAGREGLLRWFHGTRGAIPPADFIPIAERTGLIERVSRFVLEAGIRQQSAWLREGSVVPLALNLSARNLHERGLVQTLGELLERYGVPPQLIECEITESALIDDSLRAKQVLKAIRDLGIRLYVDDFGTGYCALSYLMTLPVNGLKIDRSFVREMTTNRCAEAIVASIVAMAHRLDLRVVAEGVETPHELDMLKTMGCDEAQGYFIGRPVPA